MNKYYKHFINEAERVSFDLKHRHTIKHNISKYDAAVARGMDRYKDVEKVRNLTAKYKRDSLNDLVNELLKFEENAKSNGSFVYWAENSKDVYKIVESIIEKVKAKTVVKSKSMTTEEIDLNDFIESLGVDSIETDLGEFIVQVAGEKPYHIVTPAMHKSKKDVNELFHRLYGIDENMSAEEMTNFVRELLRKKFLSAEIGITGANFLIADSGSIALTENEGNAIMSTSFPKIHIAIAGIEKIISRIDLLDVFWPTLSVHGTGQSITVYNSIFNGPKKNNEDFGPEEMHIILLDNKRTELLTFKDQSDALACIRCGACLNACPIYKNIGGYTYESTYGGPIGSVISPIYQGFKISGHLSYACTICGKCTEVCPQKIDLHSLLLDNREHELNVNKHFNIFDLGIYFYKLATLKPKFFDLGFNKIKNLFIKTLGRNLLGKKRELPEFKTSFRKQFYKNYKNN